VIWLVSVGTIVSLGIVGAIIAGGYAVYRSSGPIGGALSRGVETSLVKPLTDWANNLFKISSVFAAGPGSSVPNINTPQDVIVQGGGVAPNPLFVDDPNKFNPPPTTTPTPPPLPTPTPPTPTPTPIISAAGYYYWNRPGPDDRQLKLFEGTADALRRRGRDLTFLGISKLGPAGFQLFGSSKGYL